MILSINGKEYSIQNNKDYITLIDKNTEKYSEIGIYVNNEKPSLTVLKNGDRSLLMYLRFNSDVGFTSRSEYSEKMIDFKLANGQVDQYPGNWTVDINNANEAIIYFIKTLKMTESIKWNNDCLDS